MTSHLSDMVGAEGGGHGNSLRFPEDVELHGTDKA